MTNTLRFPRTLVAIALSGAVFPAFSADWYAAMKETTAHADFNLRYESVEQDNPLKDADALTLRTLVGITSGSVNGFSFTAELEDVRIALGQGDYSVPPAGYNAGEYSVIADPETTELHQGFVQYQQNGFTVKGGRQVIALDGQRFVGHVGWRQDWQTFDGVTAKYSTEALSLFYGYITQRNRIFAEDADLDSKDHIINASYSTSIGKFTGYAYLLEVDNDTDNSLDTYGVSYAGSTTTDAVKWLYNAEYATQSSDSGSNSFDADYLMLEGGAVVSGITGKVTYEVLGSDDGQYGFSTPLATLHKFNGWTDQFLATPAQGLEDLVFTVSGKLGGGAWTVAYHNFDANEASAEVSDLGSELDVQYVTNVAEHFTVGLKYGTYSAGDIKVDTDKLWVWVGAKF